MKLAFFAIHINRKVMLSIEFCNFMLLLCFCSVCLFFVFHKPQHTFKFSSRFFHCKNLVNLELSRNLVNGSPRK